MATFETDVRVSAEDYDAIQKIIARYKARDFFDLLPKMTDRILNSGVKMTGTKIKVLIPSLVKASIHLDEAIRFLEEKK